MKYSEWRKNLKNPENPYDLLDEKDKEDQRIKNRMRHGTLSVEVIEDLARLHQKARKAFERIGNIESAKSALLFEFRLADLKMGGSEPLIRLFIAGKYNAASTFWSAGQKYMKEEDWLIAHPKKVA